MSSYADYSYTTAEEPLPTKRRYAWWRSLRSNPTALLASILFFLVVATAIAAPLLAPHNPTLGSLRHRMQAPSLFTDQETPYPLGTDSLGRDVFSRLIYGARISLTVGISGVLLAALFGVTVGLLGGFYRGWLDDMLMRLADVQLSFPFILLAIALLVVLGPGLLNMVIVLSLSKWVVFARVTRGQVLALREMEFVEAAKAIGATDLRIMARTILPNVIPAVTVIASFSFADMIIAEAALSFLGLGLPPSVPTWGGMLSEGREYILQAWWLATLPGLAIMTVVLCINLLGDWLRDFLDPKLDD